MPKVTAMTDQLPRVPQTLRSDARDNRERILGAARELFAAEGLDVPMRKIARRAGVSWTLNLQGSSWGIKRTYLTTSVCSSGSGRRRSQPKSPSRCSWRLATT